MLPRKMPNAPKIIFGLACVATIGTASYAVMSRSIDKDSERTWGGACVDTSGCMNDPNNPDAFHLT